MGHPLQPTQSDGDITALLLPHLQFPKVTSSLTKEEDQTILEKAWKIIAEGIDPNTALVEEVKLKDFLTYFLSEAPNPLYVARALMADYDSDEPKLQGEKKYLAIAEIWFQHFIKFLKTEKTKNLTPSPSADVTPTIRNTGSIIRCGTRSQTQLTKWLMNRDGERDVIRGYLSQHSKLGGPIHLTTSSHILPFSAGDWNENQPLWPPHKKIFWDILRNWADFDIEELNGELINRPGNAFTLETTDDYFFGRLELWFDETPTPNEYQLRMKHPSKYNFPDALQRTVTFRNHADYEIELPMPSLLRIHAAVSRVSHLSGVGDYLDMIERERERLDGSVLASDGSSMAMLNEALREVWSDRLVSMG